MPCKSINVVANGKISFLSKSWVVLINTCLLYPFNGWTLRVPMISATVNNTAMNFEVHVPFWISVSMFHFILFGYILRSGLARLPLCFLNGNFWWTEILNFEEVQFLIFFPFQLMLFISCVKKIFLYPRIWFFFLELFYFTIHIFSVGCYVNWIFFSHLSSYSNWKTICWKDDPFPLSKNQLTIHSSFFWFLCSVPLMYLSKYMPRSKFRQYWSLISLEVR